MKTKLAKAVLFLLVTALVVATLVACGEQTKSFSVTVMDGDAVLTTLSVTDGGTLDYEGKVTKDGYRFVGLYIDSGFKEPFDPTTTFSGDLTVYARFAASSWTITVKPNKGTATKTSYELNTGDAYELEEPTRDGYRFVGFTYEDDNGDEQEFPTSGTYNLTRNVRVTAQWEIETYEVKLYDGETLLDTLEADYNTKAIFPVDPTKAGHTFVGWFEKDATAAFVKTTAITKDIELFASWSVNDCTVRLYDTDTGTQYAPITVKYGSVATFPADPTRDEYDFLGWFAAGSATAFDKTAVISQEEVVLTAKWAKKTFTVTLKSETFEADSVQTVEYGKRIAFPEDPAKTGYDFLGWFEDEATAAFTKSTAITKNVTLTARFEIKTFTVKLYDGGALLDTLSAAYDTAATFPEDPTKTDSNFAGWYETGAATAFDKETKLDKDYELTAKWTKKTFTVTLKSETFSADSVQTVEYGQKATFPEVNPSKVGHNFLGWYEEGSETAFGKNTAITKDTTLTAAFDPMKFTITMVNYPAWSLEVTYGETYSLPSKETIEEAICGSTSEDAWLSFTEYTSDADGFALTAEENGTFSFTYAWETAIIITASCEANPAYHKSTVTLYRENDNASMGSFSVDNGATAKTELAAVNTAWAGHTFVAWYAEKNGETAFDVESAISQPITLYARYTDDTYTVTLYNENGSVYNTISNVAYGAKVDLPTLDPTTSQDFLGWFETGATTAFDDDTPIIGDLALTARWQTVTFTVTLVNEYWDASRTQQVVRGSAAAFPTDLDPAEGYEFTGWKHGADAFATDTAITENITLTASFAKKKFTVTLYNEDNTVYNTIQNVEYGTKVSLDDLSDTESHTFSGWFARGAESAFDDENTEITANLELWATWAIKTFSVTFEGNGSQTVNWGECAVLPAVAPTQKGKTFTGWYSGETKIDGTTPIYQSYVLTPRFTPNTYTITLELLGGSGAASVEVTYGTKPQIADPKRFGYTFEGWTHDGVDFDLDVNYDIEGDIELTAVWKERTVEYDAGIFVVSGERVLLTNSTYGVTSEENHNPYQFVLSDEDKEYVRYTKKVGTNEDNLYEIKPIDSTAEGQTITLHLQQTEEEGGLTTTLEVRIVPNVDSFTLGTHFTAMSVNANNGNLFVTTSATPIANYSQPDPTSSLDVGNQNFKPDFLLKTRMDAYTTNLDFATGLKVEEMIEVDAESPVNYAADCAFEGGELVFSENIPTGKTYMLKIVPKYDPNKWDGDDSTTPREFTMKINLNTGVNVYTNEELKAAYADLSVHQINILRNITAKVSREDCFISADGRGYSTETETVTLEDADHNTYELEVDPSTPKNDFLHSVYSRVTEDPNDRIAISGNYFKIDGRNLPYIDNAHDGKYKKEGSPFTSGAGYRIANVQIGIFLYRCAESNGDGDGMRIRYADGTATMTNLRIEGNNMMNLAGYAQNLNDGYNDLLKMSASYIGVVVRGGTVNTDNVAIENTGMGFMLMGGVSGYNMSTCPYVEATVEETQACKLYFKNSRIKNSWANSIYGFDFTEIKLENSELKASCGAAISIDDRPYMKRANKLSVQPNFGYSDLNTVLIMDKASAEGIQNWVIGTEAWFVAYGMAEMAPQVAGMIEQGLTDIQPLGASERHVQDVAHQYMNFAVLVRRVGTEYGTDWANDKDGGQPALEFGEGTSVNKNFDNPTHPIYGVEIDTNHMQFVQFPGEEGDYVSVKKNVGGQIGDIILMLPTYTSNPTLVNGEVSD